MSDPFGREPEGHWRRRARAALVPIRLVGPVAVAWLIAGAVDSPLELAALPAAAVLGLLTALDHALRDGEPRPGPRAPVPAPLLKRALVVVAGLAYGGIVLAVLVLTGESGRTVAPLVAFLVASEETRERLGLPEPDAEQEQGPITFAEPVPKEFRGERDEVDPRDRFLHPRWQ